MVQALLPTRAPTHEPSTGPQVAVSEYRYNALGWRTVKRFDTSMGGYDGLDQERVMLYDAGWRMVEERVDTDLDDDADYVSQQFWGLRYIDDAVAKRINRDLTDPDGWVNNPGVSVWYQLTDSQFSVTAVLDHKGGLYERIEYDAYGNARHRPSGDANGDGLFSFADLSLFTGSGSIGSGGYHADWDLNFDGTVNASDTDLMAAQGARTTALRAGWISDPRAASTGPDNSIGYCGYVFNPERDDYTVRFRVYAPELGRWRTRDPIGYVDGSSMYEYTSSSPIRFLDPSGLTIGVHKDSSRHFKDQVNTMLNQICPGAKLNDQGVVEVPDEVRCSEEETKADPCKKDPPGCQILRKLASSTRNYVIGAPKAGDATSIQYDVNGETHIYLHRPGRPPARGRQGWEEFVHELDHAFRYESGKVPDPTTIKPGDWNYSVEEFETIAQDNEVRKWMARCGPGGGPDKDPNLFDPSSHPSIPRDHRPQLENRTPSPIVTF